MCDETRILKNLLLSTPANSSIERLREVIHKLSDWEVTVEETALGYELLSGKTPWVLVHTGSGWHARTLGDESSALAAILCGFPGNERVTARMRELQNEEYFDDVALRDAEIRDYCIISAGAPVVLDDWRVRFTDLSQDNAEGRTDRCAKLIQVDEQFQCKPEEFENILIHEMIHAYEAELNLRGIRDIVVSFLWKKLCSVAEQDGLQKLLEKLVKVRTDHGENFFVILKSTLIEIEKGLASGAILGYGENHNRGS